MTLVWIILAALFAPVIVWTWTTTRDTQARAWSEGFERARAALGLRVEALDGGDADGLFEAAGVLDGLAVRVRLDTRSSLTDSAARRSIEVIASRQDNALDALSVERLTLPMRAAPVETIDLWLKAPPGGLVLNLPTRCVLRGMLDEAGMALTARWEGSSCPLDVVRITPDEVVLRFAAHGVAPVDTEAFVTARAREAGAAIRAMSWPASTQGRLMRLWRGARQTPEAALVLERVNERLSARAITKIWTWLAKRGDGHTLHAATTSLPMPAPPALFGALGARAVDLLEAPGPDALDAAQALAALGVPDAQWPRLHRITEQKIHTMRVQLALQDLLARRHARRAEDPSAGGLSLVGDEGAAGGLSLSAPAGEVTGALSVIKAETPERE